jgi:hypothetical protein
MTTATIRGEKMGRPEYIEGNQATENFEEGLKALFKVSQSESCKGREERFPTFSNEEAETPR